MTNKPFDFSRLEENISIANHNPAWRQWYSEEIKALTKELQGIVPRFEHVGSSAVPGLKSKPIVDIMMGLDSLDVPHQTQKTLESLGYEYFGRLHANQERLFARKRSEERAFNLQVVPYRGKEWEEKLLFRDYLKAHPSEIALYSAIKEEAVGAGKTGLLEYHRHKDQVVTGILGRALNWDSFGRQAV